MLELASLVYIHDGILWIDFGINQKKLFWDPYTFRPNTILQDIPEGKQLRAKILFNVENMNISKHNTKIMYPYQIKIILPTGIEKSYFNIR